MTRQRRLAVFAGLGMAAYVLVLLTTFPAAVALRMGGVSDAAASASGSIWNGALDLGPAGGAKWSFAPLRSLGALAVAADITVRGSGTDVTGRAQWRPNRLEFDDLKGSAGWPLVESLAPGLPFRCDVALRVDIHSFALAGAQSGAVGEVRSSPGACAAKGEGGARSPLPPLSVIMTDTSGARAWIATQARPSAHLAEASIGRDGRLRGVVHSAGAALLPPGAVIGEMSIETNL